MESEYTIRIGGAAGQGMQVIGNLLAACFSDAGYYTFTHQDYVSRIKGGHSFSKLRIANHPVSSSRNTIDILLASNLETVDHRHTLQRRQTASKCLEDFSTLAICCYS